MLRPGGTELTERAIELCKFPQGAKILDIGCGPGDTVKHLGDKYGYKVTGIDKSVDMITTGKEKYPDVDIKLGDGEFLEDFTSFSFDGVMMECVLSLINLPDEALHEAFCVLKKGGKLILSDLFMKDPDPGQVAAIKMEAKRQATIPHKEGECSDDCAEEHKNRFVDFRFDGKFILDPLADQLEEIGFRIVEFEDRSEDLDTFVAEKILQDGNLDGCMADVKDKKNTGYFMLVAQKPL